MCLGGPHGAAPPKVVWLLRGQQRGRRRRGRTAPPTPNQTREKALAAALCYSPPTICFDVNLPNIKVIRDKAKPCGTQTHKWGGLVRRAVARCPARRRSRWRRLAQTLSSRACRGSSPRAGGRDIWYLTVLLLLPSPPPPPPSYCDLSLVCSDSAVLLAHCSVVAAVSKYLQVQSWFHRSHTDCHRTC